MTDIDMDIFEKPSGNVVGVATASIPLMRRNKMTDTIVARATLLNNEPHSITINTPSGLNLEDIPAFTKALNDFRDAILKAV